MTHLLRIVVFGALLCMATSCVLVPQNRRGYLADPTMQLTEDPLEAKARNKLFRSREGASGADGDPAGGGCGCSN